MGYTLTVFQLYYLMKVRKYDVEVLVFHNKLMEYGVHVAMLA